MSDAIEIAVDVPGSAYPVIVQPGLIERAGEMLKRFGFAQKAAIVSDRNVAQHFGAKLRESLRGAGFEVIEASIPPGEEHKTLADLLPVYDRLLEGKIERSTPVIGLGGGIITDMAGFVAATVLRGVPLVQMPTTLLAMVDASVGGKTGVNHARGKNLIGAFHQPRVVLIDPQALRTLPARELRAGLAECIKHQIIADAEGFSRLEREIERALALDMDYLSELIAHNVRIKARIVAEDPFEKSVRAHLNFGHTFGHAIETVLHYRYLHGECVALGMVSACNLAVDLKMIDAPARERVVKVIDKAGLPTRLEGVDVDAVFEAMAFDKKVRAGKLRLVLPDRIGHVVIRDDVPADKVRRAIQSLGE